MNRIVIILFFSLTALSCSARVDHRPSPYTPIDTNAVNINTATADQLEKLPGIGPRTAGSIIEYRTENGAFRRVEHVMLIRGMSERRFIELRPYLRTD